MRMRGWQKVVKLMGDISHDIRTITPVVTCSQTLELLFQQLFMGSSDTRAMKGEPRADQGAQAVDFLLLSRSSEMFNDGATATQARRRSPVREGSSRSRVRAGGRE